MFLFLDAPPPEPAIIPQVILSAKQLIALLFYNLSSSEKTGCIKRKRES